VSQRLDAFPLTPHGKIDRAALPAPDPANTLQDEVAAGLCTATERRVGELLGELPELEGIGLDDNSFLLGGHSLLGAQLIARLRDAFGVEIALRSLFEGPTVAALSANSIASLGRISLRISWSILSRGHRTHTGPRRLA
jgi:hypothetical protein